MKAMCIALVIAAQGCVAINDYSIFGREDAAAIDAGVDASFDAGYDAGPIPCADPIECGPGNTCSGGICVSCDADGDGVAGSTIEGCAGDDCDDASASTYPGAYPICGDGITQSCPGGFGGIGSFTEAGFGPILEVGDLREYTGRDRSTSVLFAPPPRLTTANVAVIAHENVDAVPTGRLLGFNLDGTRVDDEDLRTALTERFPGRFPSALSGSRLARISGRNILGLTGDCCAGLGRAHYDLDTGTQLAVNVDGVGFRSPNAIVMRGTEPAHSYIQWATETVPANLNFITQSGNNAETADPRLDGVEPQWFSGDGSLVIGRMQSRVFFFGANELPNLATGLLALPLEDTADRGVIVNIAAARYHGIVPQSTGFTTFALDCPEGTATACLGRPSYVNYPFPGRRLFALTRLNDQISVGVFLEISGEIHAALLGDGGTWVEESIETVFDLSALGGPVQDIAIHAFESGSDIAAMVVAVVGNEDGTARVLAREIHFCVGAD